MVRVAAVQGPALDGYIVTSDDEHQVSFILSTKLIPLIDDIDDYDIYLLLYTYLFRSLFVYIYLSIGVLTDQSQL